MMRLAAFALFVLAAGSAGAQQVGGTYTVRGTNFDGSAYKGTATIKMTSANTCRINWKTGSTSSGICMRSGGILAVSYRFSGGDNGMVIYRIQDDGSLEGVWTIDGSPGKGTETLIPR